MRPEDLAAWVKRRPFQPFRLHLASGATYDIAHPEALIVSRTTSYVFQPAAEGGYMDRLEDMLSNVLIERVTPIDAPRAAQA